jgi:hypothetical protein
VTGFCDHGDEPLDSRELFEQLNIMSSGKTPHCGVNYLF